MKYSLKCIVVFLLAAFCGCKQHNQYKGLIVGYSHQDTLEMYKVISEQFAEVAIDAKKLFGEKSKEYKRACDSAIYFSLMSTSDSMNYLGEEKRNQLKNRLRKYL